MSASRKSFRSRMYEKEDDLVQMLDLLMDARSRTSDWRYAHIGELLWNFFMVVCHLDPREHVRLWHDEAGRLVAYAMLGEDPLFECQVLPEHEWYSLEFEALNWAETRLVELRKISPLKWGGHLAAGTRQDDSRRIEFLEGNGFYYSGEYAEVNMLRSLDDPIPELNPPPGCVVRAVSGVEDIPDRAAIQNEVWQPYTVGNVDAGDYASFMRLPGYHLELDVVTVTPEGVMAAYVNGWIDPVNKIGDFGPVGARQVFRRQGMTRVALLESLRRMKAHGMDRVCISTGIKNTPARRLYESVGFKIVNRYLDYVKTG
jgi:mycothiol synthase